MKTNHFYVLCAIVTIIILSIEILIMFSGLPIEWKRTIYFGSGLLGDFLLNSFLPSHFDNRSPSWYLGFYLYSLAVGPLLLSMGVISWMRQYIKVL